jgi:hypothetical protein
MPYYVSIGRSILDRNEVNCKDDPAIIVSYKDEENKLIKQWRVHHIGIEGSVAFHTWQGEDSWRPISVRIWAQIHPRFTMSIRRPDGTTTRTTIETDPPPGELLQPTA